MPAASRVGDNAKCDSDSHGCPAGSHTVVGPAVEGSTDVLINSKPAHREGDAGLHAVCCGANSWTAKKGSGTVFVNGKPLIRKGDASVHCGGEGKLIAGSGNVNAGG